MAEPAVQLNDFPVGFDIDADTCAAASGIAFEVAKSLTDEKKFDKAIMLMQISLAKTPQNSLKRPNRLFCLGVMKIKRNIEDDFDQAITAILQAIMATPDSDTDLETYLNLLGSALLTRFYETENFDYLQRLVDSTIKDDSDRTAWLNELSLALGRHYEHDGRPYQLNASIRIARYAVDTKSSNSDRIAALNTLSMYLNKRYQITSIHDDLHEAIQHVQSAVSLATEPGRNRAASLSNLAIYLRLEYSHAEDIQVLNKAVEAAIGSVEAATEVSGSIHCLTSLSSALEKRYEELGDVKDLTEALKNSRLASQKARNNVGGYASVFNNLGGLLEVMYLRTGDVDYLNESIELTQQALESLSETHVDRALLSDNFASRLGRQYQRTGQSEILEESIKFATIAVDATQPGSIYLAERLNNLGSKLLLRHVRSPNDKDLSKAIDVTKKALNLVSRKQSTYILRNNLANLHQYKFRFTRVPKWLDEGVRVLADLVHDMELQSTNHPGLTSKRHNLAVKLSERFDLQGEEQDINEAVRLLDLTINNLNKDDQYYSICLKSLGNAYQKQSTKAQDQSHLIKKALDCFVRSSDSPQAVPLVRIRAIRQAISILHQQQDWQQADRLAAKALTFLPLVCGRYLRREDQVHAMSQVSGLAADACSVALKLGRVDRALEYLELGRGVVAGYILDAKTELDELKKDDVDLARLYEEESSKTNTAIDLGTSATTNLSARERSAAIQRLESVVERIQSIPKYRKFLKGPGIDELKSHATDSPVVIVNVTDISSDAIIFTNKCSKIVSLPGLVSRTAPISSQQQFSQYALCRTDDEKRNMQSEDDPDDERDDLSQTLAWLWSNCVELVLEKVRQLDISLSPVVPTRIYWLGSGVAASFPFHAAREKSCDPARDALHQIVSSYCPTIRILHHSQASTYSRTMVETDPASVLVVTMPTTPGEKSLPGVQKEKCAIREVCKRLYTVRELESPTTNMVLEAIPTADILHFACHGTSDTANPLNSHLILEKKINGKTTVDRLSVSKISRVIATGRARIAYLSACSTAEVRYKRLRDESLHINGAFQMAGLAHVIGSLWTAGDEICVKVAEAFYSSLTQSGTVRNFSDDRVSKALRDAVLLIQSQQPDNPSSWAQFVHFGA